MGLFISIVIGMSTSINTYAENRNSAVFEVSPITYCRSSDFSYGNLTVSNGYTTILSSTGGESFFVKPSGSSSTATVTLTTHLKSSQDYIDMGYYTEDKYTECNWSRSGPSSGVYTYTCTMSLKTGYYKFFISNNTADKLTFTGTTVSY